MALLKISNELYFGDKDLMNALFTWLEKECGATICDVVTGSRNTVLYLGGELKEVEKQIDVSCTEVVKNVYAFNID